MRPGSSRAEAGPPRLAGALTAAAATAAVLAGVGGLSLAVLLADPRVRSALGGLPDHPWWLVYRGAAGSDAAAWAVGAAVASSLVAAAALLAARRLRARASRASAVPVLAAGLFLVSMAFECLRGATALLVATDRSITAALLLSRIVYGARFAGLLALLLAALHALELREQRPVVLAPVVLGASLVLAASVPIDRSTFLAQLTFRLGDEQGVWFVNLVIGSLAPLGVTVAAVVRRQPRLVPLAGALAMLLAARELLHFGLHPVRLACGLACLALGAALLLAAISRGYLAERDARARPPATESAR